MKKLYLCRVELTYYALAENEAEARGLVDEVALDERDSVLVEEAKPGPLVGGWDGDCLVYNHEGAEVLLKDAMRGVGR